MSSPPTVVAPPDASGVSVAAGIWMRRWTWTLGNAALVFAMSAVFVWQTVYVAALKQHWHTTAANRWGLAALLALFASASAVLGVRFVRSGVWIGSDGVVLRGPLRTRSVALGDIEGFVPRAGRNQQTWPWLQRTHGRRPLAATALSHGVLKSTGAYYLPTVCDQLNALLRTLQITGASIATDPAAAREQGHRERSRQRQGLLASAAGVWLAAGLLIGTHPTTVYEVVYGGVAVLYAATAAIVVRLLAKNAESAAAPPRHSQPDRKE